MKRGRLLAAFAALALFAHPASSFAQGVTTGAIGGNVTDPAGAPVAQAQITTTNTRTGYEARGITRENGQFLIQGLEVGGPYTVTIRRIGFQPHTRTGVVVQLSQASRVDVRLEPQARVMSELVVRSTTSEIISPTSTGTKTTVSQENLERAPSLTRNLVDFTRAAPQVSSSGPGYSAGGMSNRMNNVQIDGASERDVFGLGSTGQPGGQIGAKAISIDAVKEYQVLLAPYDVRQGNFGGMLLNAVTKSGTNDFSGSFFQYYRNQDYGRNVPALRATEFFRRQTGFSLGGPIVRDRLHFFTANEWQRESTPVTGPFQGQSPDATPAFGFSDAELTRFEAAYAAKVAGAETPGTASILNSPTPMDNYFGRLDFQINPVHRLVARLNYNEALNQNRRQIGRNATTAVYSSNFHSIQSRKASPGIQLFSNFGNGISNELSLSMTVVRDRRQPTTTFPQVTVNYSGNRRIVAGADQFSQGNELDANTYELINNLSFSRGSHTFTVGTRNELVEIRNLFTQSSYGVWTFADIAAFEAGTANGFRRAFILAQQGNAYFDALQSAWYLQDLWSITPTFNLTYGLRADVSRFLTDNDFHPLVHAAYGFQETPTSTIQWSPRVAFNWDVTGNQINQLRGGVGTFVGTPPYVWLENAYIQNGRIITFLNCGSGAGNTTNPAPTFSVDVNQRTACGDGGGSQPIGDLSFLDKSLKFPQPLRANLAFDRVLPWNLVGTLEGLYSKTLNQLFFVNLNLAGPQGVDKFGRTVYGTVGTGGTSTPVRPPLVTALGGTARFNTAITTRNQNKDFAYNLTAQLRKRYANNWEAMVAYNYGKARDVQSFTSSTHISNWSFGRTISGPQETPEAATSLFDQPHKVTAFLTRTVNWGWLGSWARNLATDVTVNYQGISGSPHDYVYGGSSGRGDMNADGVSGNDLIYIPTDVNDANQIRFQSLTVTTAGVTETFTPAQQAAAFDALINASECLSSQRGQIMKRNSCRLPFSNNFDVSLRQNIPTVSGQRLAIQVDIFNFGNFLNKDWGKIQVSPFSSFNNIPVLTHISQSSADRTVAVPTFTYNLRTLDPQNTGSPDPYQPGTFVGNFWRFQVSARYSF